MDIRTMQYFLTVVREGNISAASKSLHVAQPSLSRQMKELEEELGASLFVRGNRRITLTDEGRILRKRAEEMVRLMLLTEEEIGRAKDHLSGSVRIGAGESYAFHYLSRVASELSGEFPSIRFEITSGDTKDLMDELDHGLIDFALIFSEVDHSIYESLTLPEKDHFGVLMPRNCPLSEKNEIHVSDLDGQSVIISRTAEPYFIGAGFFSGLRIVGTYNLIYNASLMVEDGLGYAICFDRLINTTGESRLCLRPLVPQLEVPGSLIWKKYELLSPPAQLFIERVRTLVENC